MERRVEHKEKLAEMRDMISTQNRWVYDNIRKQREINEIMVRKERSKEYENRRRRRDEMFED